MQNSNIFKCVNLQDVIDVIKNYDKDLLLNFRVENAIDKQSKDIYFNHVANLQYMQENAISVYCQHETAYSTVNNFLQSCKSIKLQENTSFSDLEFLLLGQVLTEDSFQFNKIVSVRKHKNKLIVTLQAYYNTYECFKCKSLFRKKQPCKHFNIEKHFNKYAI